MSVVHIKTRLPRAVPRCVARIHEHANAGRIVTLAFIAVMEEGYIADICGEVSITPEMLIELQRKVIRRHKRNAG